MSAWNGLLPFMALLVINMSVSVIGTASTSSGAAGGTTRPSPCVRAIEKNASANPSDMLPASPMNSLAGWRLYLRNAISTPQNAMPNTTSCICPLRYARAVNVAKATSDTPPASPSSPSIMFRAFITPMVQKMVIGTARGPKSMSPSVSRSPKLRSIVLL